MNIPPPGARRLGAALALLATLLPSLACARNDSAWQPREDNEAWRAECSACHIAFPPALLPADSWLAIMARLDRHFGADASLDARTREQITNYLDRNGAPKPVFGSPPDELPRITTQDWFLRKHRGAARLLLKGRVKSLADCAACHKGPEIERMKGN
ncbi:MAG TPA: cytochrome C [Rhodocyclaceae bacterium]